MKSDLSPLFARLDAVQMPDAERRAAKAALLQADALADFFLGALDLVKRLGTPRPNPAHLSA